MAKKAKKGSLWKEFKAFISRGNVLDMAVGVIIGSAFSAIVTAVVNILMSACTFAIPGGIGGLVTVLPQVSAGQRAPEGYANVISVTDFLALSVTDQQIYVQHGAKYYFKGMALIDWGSLINAVISFLIIAVTLFIIVKVANKMHQAREALKAKAQEDYYVKHPEERPVPPEPGKPEPTTNDILLEIKALLADKK